MNATKASRKMVNVNLSLSIADYEWLEAYASVTGKTLSEAASKGMSHWLGEEGDGWQLIEMLIKRQSEAAASSRKPQPKKLTNLIIFPGR